MSRILGALLVVAGLVLGALAILGRSESLAASPTTAARNVSPNSTTDNGQQKLVRTTDGTLYLAYTSPVEGVEQAHISFSLDRGDTWKPEIVLGQPGIWSALPTLAAGPGNRLDAAWVDYTTVGHTWYATRQDGAWSDQRKISPGPDYAGFPAMVIAADGTAHILWYDSHPGADTEHGSLYQIHHTAGNAGSWSTPYLLSAQSQDALNPALVMAPDGTIHGAWFEALSGNYVARHATYRDGAWDPVRNLVSTATRSATGVAIAVAPDGVHMVWESTEDGSTLILHARTEGEEWSSPEELASGVNEDPVIAVDGDGLVYVLWSSDDRIMGTVYDGGWSETVDLGRGTNPTLLGSDGDRPVVAAWTRSAGTAYEVVAGPLEMASTGNKADLLLIAAALALLGAGAYLAVRRRS
jgi:LPXTG-motif cell wall-anchored protein